MANLTVRELDQLRRLVKAASKRPAMTRQERDDKRRAERAAFKAEVLAYAQQHWDERYASFQARFPGSRMFELGLGPRPTEYQASQVLIYNRRQSVF